MKLIKTFQDYYDGAVGHGYDPSIVYVRKEAVHVSAANEFDDFPYGSRGRDSEITFHILGFCGLLYPVVKRSAYHYGREGFVGDWVHQYFYTYDEYQNWKQDPPKSWSAREVKEFFYTYTGKRLDRKFVEIDAPMFVVEYRDRQLAVVANPCLKDWGFARIKDPYTAFQEISMYLGNQLVKEPNVDTIEDKYRLANHGFDKTSFRHPVRLKDLK